MAAKVSVMCLKKLSILVITLGFVLLEKHRVCARIGRCIVKRNRPRIYFVARQKNKILRPIARRKTFLLGIGLVCEIREEVVTLVINDDKRREVLDIDLTHSLHTELGEVNNLDALDRVLCKYRSRATN